MFRDSMFQETLIVNWQLLTSLQETSRGAIQCAQMIAGIIVPMLQVKDKENRRLKRMLKEQAQSGRWKKNDSEDSSISNKKNKRTK